MLSKDSKRNDRVEIRYVFMYSNTIILDVQVRLAKNAE